MLKKLMMVAAVGSAGWVATLVWSDWLLNRVPEPTRRPEVKHEPQR
jgi:hypothetical protein